MAMQEDHLIEGLADQARHLSWLDAQGLQPLCVRGLHACTPAGPASVCTAAWCMPVLQQQSKLQAGAGKLLICTP